MLLGALFNVKHSLDFTKTDNENSSLPKMDPAFATLK